MEELLKLIGEHLAFYGYRTESEDGVLKVSHQTKAHFWVLPANGGVVFRAIFRTGPEARSAPADFLKFLNDANNISLIARYVDRQGFLSIEAWFPSYYEKEVFAVFFDQYLTDIRAPVDNNREAVERFFPAE